MSRSVTQSSAAGPLDAPAFFERGPNGLGSGAAGGFVGFAGPALVGTSGPVGALRRLVRAVAARRCTVLLHGETGTGKEVLARQLHAAGDRAAGPFVPVDCASLSDALFESQLFGHSRGAFTGAARDAIGFARAADGGTLFLDEVGELPPAQQAKLLRLLQERCVTPVGEARPVPVDVRVVCATHRDLEAMVAAGTFRQDLYYRLAIVTLTVPPLRDRPGDVRALAEHFLTAQAALYGEAVKRLSPAAARALDGHAWPGNVRELANAMERAHVLAEGDEVAPEHLPPAVTRATPRTSATPPELCLESVERHTIREALRRSHGRKTEACRLLGINLQRLNRRIDKLAIDLPAPPRGTANQR